MYFKMLKLYSFCLYSTVVGGQPIISVARTFEYTYYHLTIVVTEIHFLKTYIKLVHIDIQYVPVRVATFYFFLHK